MKKEKRKGESNQLFRTNVNNRGNLVKSPSDTTLYSPGLRKLSNTNNQREIQRTVTNQQQQYDLQPTPNGANAIEKISNFVESIRLGSTTGGDTASKQKATYPRMVISSEMNSSGKDQRRIVHHNQADSATPTTSTSRRYEENTGNEMDAERATELLLQAEKFKLRNKFVTDEGLGPIDSEILFLRNFDQDDEFFHVTSQIDPSLKAKIERGEFVDLERLLPRDRFSSGIRGDDLNKQLFQLISQGTNSYLSPPSEPKHGNRITNVKKWDQAFRVFGAIYTQANPIRSSEIWQYVYVIHTAAASNPWDNVAFYDITFRELMASKPWRSWGKTYTQGWNMAFNSGGVHGGGHYVNNHSNGSNSSNNSHKNGNGKDWRDDCCWRFNKSRCNRPSNECRYDHRCTYCAMWNSHGYQVCRKRLGRSNGNSNAGKGGNGGYKGNNNHQNFGKPTTSTSTVYPATSSSPKAENKGK